MKRRASTEAEPTAPVKPETAAPRATTHTASHDAIADARRYGQELEARYVAARNAWTLAMRVADSGRPADLASLAIAQEAYEAVAAERERWIAGGPLAIPVEPESKGHSIEVAVGQELAWRRVLEPKRPGPLARIWRRIRGR